MQPLVVQRFNLPDLSTDLNQETQKGSDVLSFDFIFLQNLIFFNFNNLFRLVNATNKKPRPLKRKGVKRPSRPDKQSERQNK